MMGNMDYKKMVAEKRANSKGEWTNDQVKEAIESEDFETASKIREQLKKFR